MITIKYKTILASAFLAASTLNSTYASDVNNEVPRVAAVSGECFLPDEQEDDILSLIPIESGVAIEPQVHSVSFFTKIKKTFYSLKLMYNLYSYLRKA